MPDKEEWPKACTCDRKPVTRDEFMRFLGDCVEHGGLWSYKCGACNDHGKRFDAFTAAEAAKNEQKLVLKERRRCWLIAVVLQRGATSVAYSTAGVIATQIAEGTSIIELEAKMEELDRLGSAPIYPPNGDILKAAQAETGQPKAG